MLNRYKFFQLYFHAHKVEIKIEIVIIVQDNNYAYIIVVLQLFSLKIIIWSELQT